MRSSLGCTARSTAFLALIALCSPSLILAQSSAPLVFSEKRERQIDTLALDSVEKAITQIEVLLKSRKDSADTLQNKSTLAELWAEKATLLFRLETGGKTRIKKSHGTAIQAWRKQEELLTDLIVSNPSHPEHLHWIESRARSCMESQNLACRKRDLWTLALSTSEKTDSRAQISRFALAEISAKEENPAAALLLLASLSNLRAQPEQRALALHRGAWSDYNLGNYLSGFEKLKASIHNYSQALQSSERGSETLEALLENSASELSLFWLEGRDHEPTETRDRHFSVAALLENLERMGLERFPAALQRATVRAAKILRTQDQDTALVELLDRTSHLKEGTILAGEVAETLLEGAFDKRKLTLLREGLKRIEADPTFATEKVLNLLQRKALDPATPYELAEVALFTLSGLPTVPEQQRALAAFQSGELASKRKAYLEAEKLYARSLELAKDSDLRSNALVSSLLARTQLPAAHSSEYPPQTISGLEPLSVNSNALPSFYPIDSLWSERFQQFHKEMDPAHPTLIAFEDWIVEQQIQAQDAKKVLSWAIHRTLQHLPSGSATEQNWSAWEKSTSWVLDTLTLSQNWDQLISYCVQVQGHFLKNSQFAAREIFENILRAQAVGTLALNRSQEKTETVRTLKQSLSQTWIQKSPRLAVLYWELLWSESEALENWATHAQLWLEAEMNREPAPWKAEDSRLRIHKKIVQVWEDNLLLEKRKELEHRFSVHQKTDFTSNSKLASKKTESDEPIHTVGDYRKALRESLSFIEKISHAASDSAWTVAGWISSIRELESRLLRLQRGIAQIAPIHFNASSGDRWIRWRIDALSEIENRLAHRTQKGTQPEILDRILAFQAALQKDAAEDLVRSKNLPPELRPLADLLQNKNTLFNHGRTELLQQDASIHQQIEASPIIESLMIASQSSEAQQRWNAYWKAARQNGEVSEQVLLLEKAHAKNWLSLEEYQKQIALILKAHDLPLSAALFLKGVQHAQAQ